MQIPDYSLRRDATTWLAWRLRVWAKRLQPTRPYLIGPFPAPAGTDYWAVMQGYDCVAEFNTRAMPSSMDQDEKEDPVGGEAD